MRKLIVIFLVLMFAGCGTYPRMNEIQDQWFEVESAEHGLYVCPRKEVLIYTSEGNYQRFLGEEQPLTKCQRITSCHELNEDSELKGRERGIVLDWERDIRLGEIEAEQGSHVLLDVSSMPRRCSRFLSEGDAVTFYRQAGAGYPPKAINVLFEKPSSE